MHKEEEPLIYSSEVDTQQCNRLKWNFILMSMAFSANHGSVVACLAYASTELGDLKGAYGGGALYICYALTSFLLSKPTVSMVGPKTGLFLGVSGYCVYVAGFLVAVVLPWIAWPVFMIAACIGGTAGGMLWTAQGRYFAGNAKLYARASLKTLEDVNSEFAGIFAASYLGLECITKALATIIFLEAPGSAPFVIFTIYTAIAFLATFAVTRLDDLGDHGTWTFDKDVVVTNVYATGRLMVSDSRLSLLVPFQIAFGLASSFVPFYVFGTVIADSDSLGGTYVGLLSAIIVLTGAAIAVPAGWAAQRFGKPVMMTIGAVGLMATGLAFFFFSDDQLGTWGMIIPYLIIYGIGRGTWENTNKAVVADYFGGSAETNTAAFAGIAFTSGLAGAFGYFAFNSMTRIQIAIMVFVSAVGALFAYYGSVAIHSNAKKSQQEV
mmetsp:Transcript_26219/g.38847  ORF Transcript_26219/g.38847 Transcript_26219/m.38847 type:complete len:437 (+) Transcript_26219:151-1461(+)|eukprot:CAMPEP_0185021088 /NCGR_PEP_ID=MMETSP1103-20130426/3746_1 /TAXON_ID=36769 /ORGANISM="Paraphysomonas bandaiensis, Strain Caron Lab Isolate" /LENGTH=436 /DNA_ID=CAMNT_0027552387 /DNA_START=135 /DNA_END=1445 /DNA_ORIENTATION=-